MNFNIHAGLPRSQLMTDMVKVWPKNDSIRRLLRHPTGVGFDANPQSDPAHWPQDQFTTRRLMDGDVLDHGPAQEVQATPIVAPAKEKVVRKSTATTEEKS